MVRPQALELLLEILFHALRLAQQIVGELCGNIYLVPNVVFLQNPAQRVLAAGVDVGGVEVVDSGPDGLHDLPLRLVQVDSAAALGEAHTAVAQNGNGISVFVVPVIHII